MPHKNFLSSIEEIIEDAKNGKMFILVDDEDRENEGDLVIPAQMADSAAINFMAKYGRGLICLAMAEKRVKELNLPLMSQHNQTRHHTAFTVSIEAREGVTTGISAADRARTIEVAIDPVKKASDIITPGHVFPLMARPGGVLVRAGHTEAAVDISVLAGLNPSGVICEIMNDDGTMARMTDLIEFAKTHNLKIATIADLIKYRRRNEKLVSRHYSSKINSSFGGEFDLHIYVNNIEYAEHIVLVKGDIKQDDNVLVRMHSLNILSDVLADTDNDRDHLLRDAMQTISKNGSGVLVLLREPRRDLVSSLLMRRDGNVDGDNHQLRDYGIGAQILIDLGIKNMILLSNYKHDIIGLEGYGLNVVEFRGVK